MRILSLDTAGHACALALTDLQGDATNSLFYRSETMTRGHAGVLAQMGAEAFDVADPQTINLIVVTNGPGGFTGMRVGLAYACAFALARRIPIIGLSTFTALRLDLGMDTPCLIDTRRGDFFYDAITAQALNLSKPETIGIIAGSQLPDQLPDSLGGSVWMSEAAKKFNLRQPHFSGGIEPDIIKLAKYASKLTPAQHPPRPIYVRPPSIG